MPGLWEPVGKCETFVGWVKPDGEEAKPLRPALTPVGGVTVWAVGGATLMAVGGDTLPEWADPPDALI